MKTAQIIKKDIVTSKDSESAKLLLLSDLHYGNMSCNKNLFEIVMKWAINDPDVYIFTVGDLLECATLTSPGFFDQNLTINDQIDYVIEHLGPFAEEGRLIGMLQGNHEYRINKLQNLDITQLIAENLFVPYGYRGSFLYMKVRQEDQKRSQLYPMYGTHGSTSSYTSGGKINACQRLMYVAEAELYFMGHVHELLHVKIPRTRIDRGNLQEYDMHFVLTGSYLNYWDSYAQQKAYPPTSLGSPTVKLHTNTHRMTVSA